MNLREQVADIVSKSHPVCGQEKECWAKCSECGANAILTAVREHIKDMRLPLIDCGDEYCQPGCHKRQRNADLEAILEELEK